MSNSTCRFCDHEFTIDCNSLTLMVKGERIRLCRNKSTDDLHPQDCYLRFRELNK